MVMYWALERTHSHVMLMGLTTDVPRSVCLRITASSMVAKFP